MRELCTMLGTVCNRLIRPSVDSRFSTSYFFWFSLLSSFGYLAPIPPKISDLLGIDLFLFFHLEKFGVKNWETSLYFKSNYEITFHFPLIFVAKSKYWLDKDMICSTHFHQWRSKSFRCKKGLEFLVVLCENHFPFARYRLFPLRSTIFARFRHFSVFWDLERGLLHWFLKSLNEKASLYSNNQIGSLILKNLLYFRHYSISSPLETIFLPKFPWISAVGI